MSNTEGKYTYEYPRPSVTADCVIFGFDGTSLRVLLIERGVEPYLGYWALPGGFMRMDESIEECARRELREETQMKDVFLEQFHCFSDVERDPRGRVVTVAFIALVRPEEHDVAGGDDAVRTAWFNADELPPLAFDHKDILKAARKHLQDTLILRPTAFYLINEVFTIDELRKVYEVINRTNYDRRNFYRKLMKSELLENVDENKVPTESVPCKSKSTPSQRSQISKRSSCELQEDAFSECESEIFEDVADSECSPIGCQCSTKNRGSVLNSSSPRHDGKGRPPKFFRLASKFLSKSKGTEETDIDSIKNLFNF